MRNFIGCVFVCWLHMAYSCGSGKNENPFNKQIIKYDSLRGSEVPPGFPLHAPAFAVPADNRFTAARIALGEKIFFTPVFSRDGKTSCASCHKPSLAFADSVPVSPGAHGRFGMRNSPSLLNIAYHPAFMIDGGVHTLELQVLAPFSGYEEMDFSLNHAVELLNQDAELTALSLRAYGRKPDAYVITRALACYERTLLSFDSPYDAYLADSAQHPLSPIAETGRKIFFSDKTGCASCHSGPLFSDFQYYNVGLYEHYADTGRARITLKITDSGKFKTPSLRNLGYTSPYMHDGSKATLYDVVAFYETGGHPHPNRSEKIRKFSLTEKERVALVAFLETLNGKLANQARNN